MRIKDEDEFDANTNYNDNDGGDKQRSKRLYRANKIVKMCRKLLLLRLFRKITGNNLEEKLKEDEEDKKKNLSTSILISLLLTSFCFFQVLFPCQTNLSSFLLFLLL